MQKEEIDRIVLGLLGQVAPEAPLEQLNDRLPFRSQFQFDSVDFLKFILGLEEKIGVKISELDYPALASLEGCRTYLVPIDAGEGRA
jgi:acyl carrier protein